MIVAPSAQLFDPIVAVRTEKITVGEHSRIDSFVKLEGGEGLTIGRHVHIASFCHIGIGGGTTILEDGTAFASGAKVLSGSNIPDAPSVSAVSPLGRAQKYTTIVRKNAAVYAGAIILPGVTLGEGCRIAAGAVVTKDVPAFETWGGIPARKLAGAKAVERC